MVPYLQMQAEQRLV